jgi:preprotein translocase subunit Sec61beta
MTPKKKSETTKLPASRAGLNFYYSGSSGGQKTIKIRPELVPILMVTFIVISVVANVMFK